MLVFNRHLGLKIRKILCLLLNCLDLGVVGSLFMSMDDKELAALFIGSKEGHKVMGFNLYQIYYFYPITQVDIITHFSSINFLFFF
jgi:hypothetical protein